MKARYGSRGDKAQKRREREVIKKIAEHQALGYRISVTVESLNALQWAKAPEGGAWTRKAVERVIEANKRIMRVAVVKLERERNPVKEIRSANCMDVAGDDEVSLKRFTAEVDREAWLLEVRQAEIAQQAATLARLDPEKDWTFHDPASGLGNGLMPTWETMPAGQDLGRLRLSGKDLWAKQVDALVEEMTRNTGKDAHELLDQIKGQADVRAQLRRVVWGLLMEIALQRQANASLRQQLGKPLRRRDDKPAPTMEEAEEQLRRLKEQDDWQAFDDLRSGRWKDE